MKKLSQVLTHWKFTLNTFYTRYLQIIIRLLKQHLIEVPSYFREDRVKIWNRFNLMKIGRISVGNENKCRAFRESKFFLHKYYGISRRIIIDTIWLSIFNPTSWMSLVTFFINAKIDIVPYNFWQSKRYAQYKEQHIGRMKIMNYTYHLFNSYPIVWFLNVQ